MIDFMLAKYDGIKLVVFKAPHSTPNSELECISVLDAAGPPSRQGDLLAYLVANPIVENIERCMLILLASAYKVGDEDAAKLFLNDQAKLRGTDQ